jgi:hypothetical protein
MPHSGHVKGWIRDESGEIYADFTLNQYSMGRPGVTAHPA